MLINLVLKLYELLNLGIIAEMQLNSYILQTIQWNGLGHTYTLSKLYGTWLVLHICRLITAPENLN